MTAERRGRTCQQHGCNAPIEVGGLCMEHWKLFVETNCHPQAEIGEIETVVIAPPALRANSKRVMNFMTTALQTEPQRDALRAEGWHLWAVDYVSGLERWMRPACAGNRNGSC